MSSNKLTKKVYKKCLVCGKIYLDKRHSKRRKYCGSKCIQKAMSKRFRETRRLNKELGKCAMCGALIDNKKYLNCAECRLKYREYYHKNKK